MTNFGLYGSVSYANSLMDGWFVGMLIIAFTIIMFISLKRFETEKALIVTAFAGLVVSIPLVYINLLNWIFIFIYGIGLASLLAYVYATSK